MLGVDDGLVSNFALVMGVAGAGATVHELLVTGLAGLLAGALSMALGEWLSVQSARELYARQIQLEGARVIDPSELGGSAYVASITSFLTFAVGAVIPLVPLAFLPATAVVLASAVLSGVALFKIGALITLLTGQPLVRAGLRQLAIGVVAAAITFGAGRLVGAAL